MRATAYLRPALVVGLVLAATPALAQSFLEGMARQAAEGIARKAAERAAAAATSRVTGAGRTAPAEAEPSAPANWPASPAPAASQLAANPAPVPVVMGPAPWPTNAGDPSIKRPGDLEFSPETEALATAFDDFGMVRCTGCEGGRTYDSWAQHSIKLERGYGAWERKLGGLALGETLTWQGVESAGKITVVAESPVGAFRCKQLKWELFKKDARAERPGLVCWGYSSPYSGSESWVEVF